MGLIDYKNALYLYYNAALQKFLVFRLLYLPCGSQITHFVTIKSIIRNMFYKYNGFYASRKHFPDILR